MKKRLIRVVSLCVVAVMLFGFNAQAATAPSFTHWETASETLTVQSADMYVPVMTVDAADLGLEDSMEGITDVFCAEDGKTYILCGENSKLYVLNKDYTFDREIVVVDAEGEEVSYEGALGVYAEGDIIYLCDTDNARILVLDQAGVVQNEMVLPDSDVIPDDFLFQPTEIARDADNNFYILSKGSFYGALLFSPELEFVSFYGANAVEYTVLDAFGYLWDLLTNTDAKREKQVRNLPYAFVSMTADNEGFLYTTTSAQIGQVKMLSPGGSNILKSRDLHGESVDASTHQFTEVDVISNYAGSQQQKMDVIAVNDNGYIFVLESLYGFVYVYDNECNLLSAFGGGVGQGAELGKFSGAVAMALNGDQVIIGDNVQNRISVFEITEYGALVQKAQALYKEGNYAEAKPLWEDVLAQDSNSRLAYAGLAKAYYVSGEYEKSMEYAEIAYDYTTYDQAYRQVRNASLEENFVWIFVLLVAVIALVVVFLLYIKKRQASMIGNIKMRTLMNTPIHPFQSFTDIKYKGQGSLLAAIILIVLFSFTSILRITASSFLFRTVDVYNYNSVFTLATTAGLVILWIVANWLACTLMEGKGRMGEIAIVTAYSLIPMIIYNVIATVLSYALTYDDVALLNGLSVVALIFTAFLLIVAIMTVHEYSFGKLILSTIVSVFFMILIVFVIFMMVILIQQLFNFIISLYTEVAYR